MKAAVIFDKGGAPQYIDYPDPSITNDEQLIISMKAAAIKHFDKGIASGKHYSASKDKSKAKIIGGDGVGILENGKRVFAFGRGMIAGKALIEKNAMIYLPDGIDDITAAALPNAVAGSAMALRFRADLHRGETVLINGATGFTGRIAVQIAKHYGAKKIIVTGRNEASLEDLADLGANELIRLTEDDETLIHKIKAIHSVSPVDVIIDYLWGHTAELILASIKGNGDYGNKIRYISIGAMTGDTIQLSAEILRSVDLKLCGSGLGSWSPEQMKTLVSEIIPEMFELAARGKIKVDTVEVALSDIENLWSLEVPGGRRVVVRINQ